jgi:hypothetical protein
VRDRVAGDGICGAEVGDHLVARHSTQPKARETSWEGSGDWYYYLRLDRVRQGVRAGPGRDRVEAGVQLLSLREEPQLAED